MLLHPETSLFLSEKWVLISSLHISVDWRCHLGEWLRCLKGGATEEACENRVLFTRLKVDHVPDRAPLILPATL